MTTNNKAILAQFYRELFEQGDLSAVDRHVADDYLDHTPPPGMGSDRESLRGFVGLLHAAFSNQQYAYQPMVAEDDRVVCHWTMRAVNTGAFFGVPPTGKEIAMSGMDMVRIADGRVHDIWHVDDVFGLMQQIAPAPPGAAAPPEAPIK